MDRVLRDVVLAIGSLLGIIRTGDPSLNVRVFRDPQAIYLNIEIAHAFPSEARRLLETGTALSLVLTVDAPGYRSLRFSHGIAYDSISEEYTVRIEETGKEHSTLSGDVAVEIASRVYGLRLMDCGSFDQKRGLALTVSCAIEAPDIDASVVWNYRSPSARVSYDTLSGIPH